MRLSIKSLALTSAILWGASVLFLGVANAIWPTYAVACLQTISSIYPGYHVTGSIGSVIVGTLYAVVDGAVAGLLFGWIYNRLARGAQETEGA